jgi:hypothetical protein
MAANPWHPRVVPFLFYVAALPVVEWGRSFSPWLYPALYLVQCLVVAALLYRYRKLLPELTLSWHWSAIPSGVLALVLWIALGLGMVWLAPPWFAPTMTVEGQPTPHFFQEMGAVSAGLMWTALGLRLLGMSLVVPMFEELFVRSLCLRSFHRVRATGAGVVQILHDLPLVGDWLAGSDLASRADRHGAVFGKEFSRTPVGALTVFGVTASTLIFMVHHVPRDWPGCIAVGVLWCLHVWFTNRPGSSRKLGLGPVIWAHGITNALLWAYTLIANDWQFL